MKPLLPLFILLFFTTNLFSKEYSLIVEKPFEDALFDITQSHDRSLFAVGFSHSLNTNAAVDTKTYTDAFEYLSSLSDANGMQMHLLKADNSANILLSKSTKLARMNRAKSVVKMNNGDYVVVGETQDGEILLSKFTPSGELYFSKSFKTTAEARMRDMIVTHKGEYLIIGSSATSRNSYDPLFGNGLGKNDIFLLLISAQGEEIWSNKFGGSEDDVGVSVAAARDGTFLIAAKTQSKNSSKVTLLRINQKGAKLWLKSIQMPSSAEPTKIIALRDGTFLVSIKEFDKTQKESIRLLKMTLGGTILANKKIPTRYASALLDIAEFANGSLFGVGYVRDGHDTDALAMAVGKNLTLINQEHYGSKSYDAFHAATILHNSQVAAAGIHTNAASQEANMWVVKLNQNATLAQTSGSPKSHKNHTPSNDFYTQLTKLFAPEIAKKELAIKRNLTIELIEPSLYFSAGVYTLTPKQQSFLKRFSNKLLPFLMKQSNKVKTLELNGHTSSEWAKSDFTQGYINNAELSMQRSFSVMRYIFLEQNHQTQLYLSKMFKQSGLSYSKKVVQNGKEDKERSRRVNFRVILK